MNFNFLISIIVPVYNCKDYLTKCIDSILSQTYKNLEVVLIDDGSTDGSGEICDEYANTTDIIKTFHQPRNLGPSNARNLGIKKANGKWLMFVDSDDWLDADALQKCIDIYSDDVDLILLDVYKKNGNVVKDRCVCTANVQQNLCGFIAKCRTNNTDWYNGNEVKQFYLMDQHAKLYKKSIIDDNDVLFPSNIWDNEDGFFNMEYIRYCNKIISKNEPIYHIVVRDNSLSRAFDCKAERMIISMDYYHSFLKKLNFFEQMKKNVGYDVFERTLLICLIYARACVYNYENFYKSKKNLLKTTKHQLIQNSLSIIDIKYIKSLKNKILAFCIKHKMFGLLYFMFVVYYRVKKFCN